MQVTTPIPTANNEMRAPAGSLCRCPVFSVQHLVSKQHSGYTLLEVVVVLILLAVAAAVVAPSLLAPRLAPKSSSVHVVVGAVREAAVRRGEQVHLQVDRTGAWRAMAGSLPRGELLMSGRLSDLQTSPTDIVFSPLGTCAPTPESTPSEELAGLNPLTCEARVK